MCEFNIIYTSDHSGFIDFNEFKTVFSANLGPEAIPFDFDWLVPF